MWERTDEINRALASVAARVTGELASDGWQRQHLFAPRRAYFTREFPSGVLATAEFGPSSAGWRDEWPVEMAVRIGVGYGPALRLMPILTMRPVASLAYAPQTSHAPLALGGPADIAATSDEVVAVIRQHGLSFAVRFADPAALALTVLSTPQLTLGDLQSFASNLGSATRPPTMVDLAFLAAMGRHQHARIALAAYAAGEPAAGPGRSDTRFVRQLTRWLDAGGPAPPLLEETIERLPSGPSFRGNFSWSEARATSRRRDAALKAVRAQSKGKTLDEIVRLTDVEVQARGVQVDSAVAALTARFQVLRHRPFGRLRQLALFTAALMQMAKDCVRLVRNRPVQELDWLLPPDGASFPVRADNGRMTTVSLDPDAQAWLGSVAGQAVRRLGPIAIIDVWLSRDGTGSAAIVAHVGDRRIGTITPVDQPAFEPVLTAAAQFDEDPVLKGQLVKVGAAHLVLQIPLPALPVESA